MAVAPNLLADGEGQNSVPCTKPEPWIVHHRNTSFKLWRLALPTDNPSIPQVDLERGLHPEYTPRTHYLNLPLVA